MKKMLAALAIIAIVSCHTSPYIFDIPKILATDARKLPDVLGTPYKETLPEPATLSLVNPEARYVYRKSNYTLNIYFNYNTGVINTIRAVKILSGTDALNIDTADEKAALTSKLNITSIYITNYNTSQIRILNGPNNHKFVNIDIMLKE